MAAGSAPKKVTARKAPAKRTPAAKKSAGAAPESQRRRRYDVQTTVVMSSEMDAALDEFAAKHRITRSEAIRVFLEYGRTQADRYTKSGLPRAS